MVDTVVKTASEGLGPFIGILLGAGVVVGTLKAYLARFKRVEIRQDKIFGADTGEPLFILRTECGLSQAACQLQICSKVEAATLNAAKAATEAKAAAFSAVQAAEKAVIHMEKITNDQARNLGSVTNYLRWMMAKGGMTASEIENVLAGRIP